MELYRRVLMSCILFMMCIPLAPFTSTIEITNSTPAKKSENPFKTYYSDPLELTALEIDPEANIAYIGCEYGLIIKNLTKNDFQVVAYFDGLDDSQIVDLDLDKIHSRLFILVYGSSCVFVMDLDSLEIIERFQFDLSNTIFYGERLLHICYDNNENRLFLGFKIGLVVLDLDSYKYELYDALSYFDINTPDQSEHEVYHSFSIYDLEYNYNTNKLYVATTRGLSIFDIESQKFKNFRKDSKLAGYVYDVMYIENLNKLFLAMDTLVEFDLENNDAVEYPKIIEEGFNFSVYSLAYDKKHNLIYAFQVEDEWNYYHFLVFNPLTRKSVREIWLDPRKDPHGPSLPHLVYDNIQDVLYMGVGRITSKTSDRTSYGYKEYTLFSYNYDTNESVPINITNHISIEDRIYDIEVIPGVGKILIIDLDHNLLLFDSNANYIKDFKTWSEQICDIKIINNSFYLLGKSSLKTLNLTSGEIQNIIHFNYSYLPVLDIGKITEKFYIGTEYGLIVYDKKLNHTQIYPLVGKYPPPNLFGLVVDEQKEIVYIAHSDGLYKFYINNGSFELIENTSHYGQLGIHYNSNTLVVSRENPFAPNLDLPGFPDTGTINTFYIDQNSDKLYAVTGMHPTGGGSIDKGFHSPEESHYYMDHAGGIIIYDFITKTFVNYSVDQGLPSNILSCVAYDPVKKLIHVTGDRFYSVVNETRLSNNFLKKNVTNSIFTPKEIENRTNAGYPVIVIYTIISSVSLIMILLFVLIIEPSKYKFMAVFAAPLYTRLKKDKILEHEVRGRIVGYLQNEPGTHYNELKKNLELNNGALSYHLRVLEREGQIRSKNHGIYKYFFPRSMPLPKRIFRMNEVQKLILKKLMEHPGLSQKSIAKEIGSLTSTVNYNIKIMSEKGIVELKKEGKETKCYIIFKNDDY